jgi:hypothetical protein
MHVENLQPFTGNGEVSIQVNYSREGRKTILKNQFTTQIKVKPI